MNKFITSCAIVTLGYLSAFGWGQKGHDTVAFIAGKHLTPATTDSINALLDGYSLVYWANWLDNASHTPDFAYTKTWHYKNIDADQTFQTAPNIPEGDIIQALKEQVEILTNTTATKDDKALALKMVVHFLGDIHQPMHLGRAADRGGNSHKVTFFQNDTNLHSVWDTSLVEAAHKWSHIEWQEEIDRLSPERIISIISGGTPVIWGEETYEISKQIYASTPETTDIQYDYIAKWTPTIEMQLEKGGLRLADLLNSIFDPGYIPLNSFVKK